jgi:predicted CoA-binding protein
MPVPDPHPPEVLDVLRRRGPKTRIAVSGASNDPAKYGNIIVRNLKEKGYTVLPVNPREDLIEGLPVAHAIGEIEKPVDILVVVTPPAVTLRVLREAAEAGLPAVWLQDGSFDDAVLEFAATAPFKTVHHACVMVASNF